MQIEQAELVAQLRKQAHEYSEASRMMAEAKSLRQADNTERRTDLYAFQSPEGTVQWKAADLIEQQAAQIAALSARPATLTEIETVARPADRDMVEKMLEALEEIAHGDDLTREDCRYIALKCPIVDPRNRYVPE